MQLAPECTCLLVAMIGWYCEAHGVWEKECIWLVEVAGAVGWSCEGWSGRVRVGAMPGWSVTVWCSLICLASLTMGNSCPVQRAAMPTPPAL